MTSATRCRVFHCRGGSPRCIACQCRALRDGLNSEGLKTAAAIPAVRNMFCSDNIPERIIV